MRTIAGLGLVVRRALGPLACALALGLGACGGAGTGEATTSEGATGETSAATGETSAATGETSAATGDTSDATGERSVGVDLVTGERRARPAPAGREGDVCEWGERSEASGEPLPAPAPCGPDLTCCYGGGVAGLDSRCMRVENDECPQFP